MEVQWSPYKILEIDNTWTCAGYARTQGRRCSNHLSFAKTDAAGMLLNRISHHTISSDEAFYRRLEALVYCLLCSQWHGNQAKSLLETWKRRILTFQRTQAVQKIQSLEITVEDITAKLEASSLTVPQPFSSHRSSEDRVLEENRSAQSQEYNIHGALRPSAISSSSSQRFPTVRNGYTLSPGLLLNDSGNPLWRQSKKQVSYKGTTSSDRRTTPPTPARAQQAVNGNSQIHTLKEAKSDCPICFDGFESRHTVSRCHGCLEKFHESCINLWLEQSKETTVHATCPCWCVSPIFST